MAEESTRIVHGPTFKNLLDNVTKLEKQTQKKDLSSDEKSVLAQDLLSCLLDALDMLLYFVQLRIAKVKGLPR